MSGRRALAVFAALLCLSGHAVLHADEADIRVDRIYAAPETGLSESQAKALVETAIRLSRERYQAFFPGASGSLKLEVAFVDNPRMAVLTGRSGAGLKETVTIQWNEVSELDAFLPPLVFSLWARAAGLADDWRGKAPEPTLELNSGSCRVALGIDPSYPQTYGSVTALPAGGIMLSGVGFLAEFDARLAVRERYVVDPAAPYQYFYLLDSTLSGTVTGVTATGDVWTRAPGEDAFRKTTQLQPLPPSINLDAGGAIVYQEYTPMAYVKVQGRRKTALKLEGPAPLSVAPLDFDEDGRMWSYDLVSGFMRCHGQDGSLLQVLRLIMPAGTSLAPDRVFVRGSEFVLASRTGLMSFDRFGLPLWKLDQFTPQADPLVQGTVWSSAVGRYGELYLAFSANGFTLTRYDDDASIAAVRRSVDPGLADVLGRARELNAAVRANPDDVKAYARRADLFQDAGFALVELTLRQAMAGAFPSDASNSARLAELSGGFERVAALNTAAAVYEPLSRYGAETARAAYQNAMRLLEKYLGDHPGDRDVAAAMSALGDAFRQKEAGTVPVRPSTLAVEAKLGPVFPAFMERYRTVPIGSVRIKNTGSAAVSGMRVTVAMRDVLDYPAEIDVAGSLAPGASVDVPVTLILNRFILEFREDVTVQASVSVVSAGADGRTQAPVTFRSRSALTWEDTAALAAFVTPNDDTIVAFAHGALALNPPPLFDRAFSRAFAIITALGARGLVYAEDPSSPFSRAAAGSYPVDTVRLPRQTLASGGGDCDDTTALLASCLEAAGVRTAILTTPGHVFLAFAADSPPDGPGRYADPGGRYAALARDGVWWIPIETTVLSKGFSEAWQKGSAEVAHAGLDITTIEEARTSYPALPLSGTPGETPLPSDAQARDLAGRALEALESVYAASFRRTADSASGVAKSAALNGYGVRLMQFGDYEGAATAFRQAIAADKKGAAPRVNLVAALLRLGDEKGALAALAEARRDLPGSSLIANLAERIESPGMTGGPAQVSGQTGQDPGVRSSGEVELAPEW